MLDMEKERKKKQEGRLRQLCVEEVQSKRELEVAKNAEEKLLREARRRQDEFKMPNAIPNQIPNWPSQPIINHQMMSNNHSHMPDHQPKPSYAIEKMNHIGNSNHQDVPPPLPTSPPPFEPSYQTVYSQKPAFMSNQRLNDSHVCNRILVVSMESNN
ncbi:uncharacterized protein CDAR_23711 [Caerostris darwini]|uniref:Uncharacterized protein n=1 Tax=Caerostris darwini TaxID=1538125 RepID=A0AAV4RRB4_9ARAC|nr:uncharacterized protein CDAR_23711 [Caerostris darwini]